MATGTAIVRVSGERLSHGRPGRFLTACQRGRQSERTKEARTDLRWRSRRSGSSVRQRTVLKTHYAASRHESGEDSLCRKAKSVAWNRLEPAASHRTTRRTRFVFPKFITFPNILIQPLTVPYISLHILCNRVSTLKLPITKQGAYEKWNTKNRGNDCPPCYVITC